MDYKTVILLAFVFSLVSCNNEKQIKLYDIDITINKDWNHEKIKSIDSSIDAFTNCFGDTIFFKKTKETPRIYDIPIIMTYNDKKLMDSLQISSENIAFSNQPAIDRDLCIYSNEYYLYYNINNKQAILRIPKLNKKGVFGLSIENINKDNENIIVYTNQMRYERIDEVLKIFNSIKWYPDSLDLQSR